jgi:hypothetical protein
MSRKLTDLDLELDVLVIVGKAAEVRHRAEVRQGVAAPTGF